MRGLEITIDFYTGLPHLTSHVLYDYWPQFKVLIFHAIVYLCCVLLTLPWQHTGADPWGGGGGAGGPMPPPSGLSPRKTRRFATSLARGYFVAVHISV